MAGVSAGCCITCAGTKTPGWFWIVSFIAPPLVGWKKGLVQLKIPSMRKILGLNLVRALTRLRHPTVKQHRHGICCLPASRGTPPRGICFHAGDLLTGYQKNQLSTSVLGKEFEYFKVLYHTPCCLPIGCVLARGNRTTPLPTPHSVTGSSFALPGSGAACCPALRLQSQRVHSSVIRQKPW